MALPELSLLAVFLTGLLGGVHCAGMCGGIVSALGMMQQRPMSGYPRFPVSVVAAGSSTLKTHTVSPLVAVASYNLGRIATYTLLGALAGGVGSVAWMMHSILPVQQVAYFIGNVLVILMGLYVFGFRRIGVLVESWGSPVWKLVRPLATSRLQGAGHVNSILAGSLWGLVPCGMVYAVLSAALVSGSWQQGALLMLTFGLGTLPNLMLLGLSGQWLARASRNQRIRRIAGMLIMLFGAAGLLLWGRMMSMTHA
ncbi:MAG: sulfite exporter TauE/SafE family protein [Granulosicoccus sp.]|nr:sulfite exporter TauE/SafE family protein [Granulosicoccus sp.]